MQKAEVRKQKLYRIRLFATAREKVGRDTLAIMMFEEATLQDLQDTISVAYPFFKDMPGRWAINLEFAKWNHLLQPGDEIAFIPPVSGG